MLDLDWLCTSDVDDKAFKNMVQSWPLLEPRPPHTTLSTLDIHFAACSIDANSEPFSTTFPNEMTTWLCVGFSPIVDPKAVACQLYALLPNLTRVVRHEWGVDDEREVPFYKEWNMVNEYLQVLTEGAVLRENIGKLWKES
ncbi:hypothetical protein AZE42_11570 [Rhizopogon vesiculosus]|uniref:Uncharacterized protein n=1 Tax=Rhizopogon vesiculosus TaxID=180088 RepID=A0A1J8R0K0_9AGAM|nr:hypothetical protein AZE42_11570 [Rhizopogon vesiculosus]